MLDECGSGSPETRRLKQEEFFRANWRGWIDRESLRDVADFETLAPLDDSGVREQSEQGAEQNGFAGAVRSDHGQRFALPQCEGDVMQNPCAVDRNAEIFN